MEGERHVRIVVVDGPERAKRIRDAIACRAHQLYEIRGCAPGHELEDWRQAEHEVVSPLCCGFISLEDRISLSTDASAFEVGTIEIYVEPRHLTLCGKAPFRKEDLGKECGSKPYENVVFRVFDLPVEIEPSQVTARMNEPFLEINLPKVQRSQKTQIEASAA